MNTAKAIDKILDNVSKKITPTKSEEKQLISIIRLVERSVERSISGLSYTLAGSFTRDTWMKDKKEFDIFIMFPENVTNQELERKGLELGKKIVKDIKGTYKVAYAEHPYTRAKFRGYDVDIVPCYNLSDTSKIKSSVDRTPFHNRYLTKRFTPSLSKQTRLLKQFLKANNLYGSNTKTQGFSGYLCELLIYNYKTFNSLIIQASDWEPGVYIDIEKHHKNRPHYPNPLIVIDPVDPKRNVSAVVSSDNFMKFVSVCKQFKNKPKESLFFKKPVKPKPLKSVLESRKTQFLAIEFKKPDILDDILYPQLRRTAKRLVKLLKDYEFQVMGYDIYANNKCTIMLEMEVWSLPHVRKLHGPPISVKNHSKEFIFKYKKTRLWVEDDSWKAEIKRKYPIAESLLKKTLSQSPASLKEAGIASYVAKSMKNFKILKNSQLASRAKSKDFYEFLINYLENRVVV